MLDAFRLQWPARPVATPAKNCMALRKRSRISGHRMGKLALPVAGAILALIGFDAAAEYTVTYDRMLDPGTPPTAMAIGDVDGDGRGDLVVATDYSPHPDLAPGVLVYLQQPDGTLAEPIRHGFGAGRAIAIGMLDRDRMQEIVVEHETGIAILDRDVSRLQPVARDAAHGNDLSQSGYRIELIDVDRDGALDIVTKPFGRDIVIYFGDGQGGIRRIARRTLGLSNYVDATSADFNSDGYRDFVVLSSVLRAYVFLNDGSDTFAAPYVLNPNPAGVSFYPAIAAGDFNNDGRDDLVFTTDTATLSLFEQPDGGRLSHSRDLAVEWGGSDVLLAHDVDRDGRTDLLALHGSVGLFRQGDDGLEPERLLPAGGSRFNMAVGDLDGDDCPEIVTESYTSPVVVIHKGQGCQPMADIRVDLRAGPDRVLLTIGNTGDATAVAPETLVEISVASGTLDVGNTAGCTIDEALPRHAVLTCAGKDIPAGGTSTLTIPVTVHSNDRRNLLSIVASSSTTTAEAELGNNTASASVRTWQP